VFYADHSQTTLLLALEDVTERRAIEREKAELLRQTEELLRQKDVLLRELEHRVANSLQIIASAMNAPEPYLILYGMLREFVRFRS
jgi:hypothetical protein